LINQFNYKSKNPLKAHQEVVGADRQGQLQGHHCHYVTSADGRRGKHATLGSICSTDAHIVHLQASRRNRMQNSSA
jgi:hypothetical protein